MSFFVNTGNLCEFCIEDLSDKSHPVRRTFPDWEKEGFHYRSIEDTPTEVREIDDYQPRSQLRKCFHAGE